MSGGCIASGEGGRSCRQPAMTGGLFCMAHHQAPAAQRGGWLSAERRRRALAAGQPLEASNIIPRLWVGSAPPFDRDLPVFDTLVLCAREIQPPHLPFHGHVIRCPIQDSQPTPAEISRVLITARTVADHLVARRRVLVTCAQGLNRSALVAAVAISRLTRRSAEEITQLIRERRNPQCLFNPHFRSLLQRVAGDGRGPAPRRR